MRSDVLNQNSGSYTIKDSGVIKVLKQSASFTASSTDIVSGAMTLPEACVIVRLSAVVTTALAYATATVGIAVGTAAAGVQLVVDDPNGIAGSTTALAVGKGVSTYAELNTALAGNAAHVIVPDAAYQLGGTDVHFTVDVHTGAFTAGEMCFIVEYIPIRDNV
tara:strand:- start:56 stop:544 length:489 start_codon:yes stop_codon:yes gene_type:complete